MSAIDGELNEDVLALPLGGGDFSEPALVARLLEFPLVDILPVVLRLKRPIPVWRVRLPTAGGGNPDHASCRGSTAGNQQCKAIVPRLTGR